MTMAKTIAHSSLVDLLVAVKSSYQSQFPVLIVYEQILAASTSSSTTLNQYMYMHMCTSERCRAADGAQ